MNARQILANLVGILAVVLFLFCYEASAHPPIPAYDAPNLDALAFAIYQQALSEHYRLEPGEEDQLAREFHAAGLLSNVSPTFLAAVTWTESRWKGKTLGDGGASVGAWQMVASSVRVLFPSVSRKQARELLLWPLTRTVIAGLYWARLIKRYGRRRAAVVYNCGPVRCRRATTTKAVRGYFRHWRQLKRRLERAQ